MQNYMPVHVNIQRQRDRGRALPELSRPVRREASADDKKRAALAAATLYVCTPSANLHVCTCRSTPYIAPSVRAHTSVRIPPTT